MTINWIDHDFGTASLQEFRKLYQGKAVQAFDGKPKPSGPSVGHVHLIGADKDPIIITLVIPSQDRVHVKKVPKVLAPHLFQKATTQTEKGIYINEK